MRKPVIAGNWKMYKTVADSIATAVALKPLVANANHCEVIIAPVFTSLKSVADRLEGSNIRVSAQNCATEKAEGAYTGEIAAFMIHDAGCSHVIVGHSERRQYYLETDQIVSKKAHAALAAGLTAIVCVGETLEQRDQGKALDVVKEQIVGSLSELTASDLVRIIVAYEPVWAIGTGRTATPEQAQEMHAFIRRVFAERHSEAAADTLRILYGGSVKPNNIAGLMKQIDIDGALVGGASLKAESFAQIVNYNE
ncbi:MAG TPA: triose-phosphate isomerase [Pyrinomonadaceae bacterium]|jgi:triosephosphate isomerase|nr:triose-phosphate isomerase [Pyrinomonadaceae bacterium]